MLKQYMVTVGVLALGWNGIAQAAEVKPCLSAEQAEGLVVYLLPKAIGAAQTQCSTLLPRSAKLLDRTSAQITEYKNASSAAWPQAKASITTLSNGKLPKFISDDLLKGIAEAMIVDVIGDKIKVDECELINKIYTSVEPMPARNLGSLAVAILAESTKDKPKSEISICKMSS